MTEQDSNNESGEESVNVARHKIIFVGNESIRKNTIISSIMDIPFSEVYEP